MGALTQSWVAHSPKLKGQTKRYKKFSIAKYGEEKAFALAVQAREVFVAELGEVGNFHHRAARKTMRALATRSSSALEA
ncbi:AP2 domain-containing protein [Massilia glaciei]|uniref:AP2 domain-containing protein n=2 Tax=Massilia glaciei TaxID=1524097 RepID=A0A2U2H8R9_9BURK|nr:AP2 domain-containing protein [Massilia glaciei]